MAKNIKKRMLSYFFRNELPIYRYDYDKAIEYMRCLPEPKNDLERSFNQYLCQLYYQKSGLKFILNIISLILIVPHIIWLLVKKKKYIVHESKVAVHTENEKWKTFIPVILFQNFLNWYYFKYHTGHSLHYKDIVFILKIWKKYLFYPFFVYKNMLKIAYYRYMIDYFSPEAIVCDNEYSFTSSILTSFCEVNRIKHINIMHGERLLEIRASFFRYHECYVWNSLYADLFLKLRACFGQFVVAVPPALQINVKEWRETKYLYDFKYYLGAPSLDEIKCIKQVIEQLVCWGYKVQVRPHPLYTDMDLLYSQIDKSYIEDLSFPIEKSISNTNAVIGAGSTVLLQAFLCKIQVIWDDIVYKERFERFSQYGYVLAKGKIKMLSEVLDNLSKII